MVIEVKAEAPFRGDIDGKTKKAKKKRKTCNTCLEKCHGDVECPKRPKGFLTPYQGQRRCFGAFKCGRCSRAWYSAYSWANKGQYCLECNGDLVYPHIQVPVSGRRIHSWPLKKPPKHNASKKQHVQDLCEMCLSLGACCSSISRNPMRK